MNTIRKISTDPISTDRSFAITSLALLKPEDSVKSVIGQKAAVTKEPVYKKNHDMIEKAVVSEGKTDFQINKKHFINKINFMNFQDQPIGIHFKRTDDRYSGRTVYAIPSPCSQDKIFCTWCNPDEICSIMDTHLFSHIEIRTGNTNLTAEPDLASFKNSGMEFDLNEKCFQWPITGVLVPARHGLKIRMTQNDSVYEGILREFSSEKLGIQLYFAPRQIPLWIDDSRGVNLTIFDGTNILYNGECTVLELSDHAANGVLMLSPRLQKVPRFKPTKYRSIRQTLFPVPNIEFVHPLTGKPVSFKAIDLSGSGACVEDHPERPSLLAGMVIPELSIEFSHSSNIKCRAQVIYSEKSSKRGDTRIQAGIALLDINFRDYIRLASLLHQAKDGKAYVCPQIDTEALWEFFFETGFIYPEKYEHFQRNKKEIKKLYEKLYTRSLPIAGHFTYQDNGTILGHMSMLRLYDRAWMIHHHAARKTCQVKAGVAVLKQIGRFSYEGHRFRSSHMDYLFCYYRPDNLFPAFVFGGAVTAINHPQQCSEDTFAYLHVTGSSRQADFPGQSWTLEDADPDDFSILNEHYKQISGGMMVQALDLYPEFEMKNCLEQEYEQHGFLKEKYVLSLKESGQLKAVVLVNKTDIGLNMSDLTNSIKVMVVDGKDLDRDTIMAAVRSIAATFPADDVPLLVHPLSYAESVGLDIEKKYNLWIMKMQYSDKYFTYIDTLFENHLKRNGR